MRSFLIKAVKSPVSIMIAAIAVYIIIVLMLSKCFGKKDVSPHDDLRVNTAAVTTEAPSENVTADTSASLTTQITTAVTLTSTVTASSTETTTKPLPERPELSYNYQTAKESPNHDFYSDHLCVIGDSIGYGFNVYGYIPDERNLAAANVSMWNINSFMFNKGGGEMTLSDSARFINPGLIYISIGMNDLYMNSPESFAEKYKLFISDILAKVPDVTIIAGAITPVTADNYFTNNELVRSFNTSLKNMILEYNSPQLYYFDAYSVLADPNTLTLDYSNSSGDGIHLTSYCYEKILKSLYSFLDQTSARENIKAHDKI